MNKSRQAVIVAGLRTPFAKRRTALKHFSPLDLGKLVCGELLERVDIDPKTVEQVVFGQVIPSLQAPNVAREIVLGLGMPAEIPAYTVSKACITSYQTTVNVLEAIQEGAIMCGIAGGTESASDVPIAVSKPLQEALHEAAGAKTLVQRLLAFKNLSPRDLLPRPPAIAEPTTGETMGEAGERMAKENGISRQAQDEFARRSHQRAARAWREGRFSDEVMAVPIPPQFTATLEEDNLLRPESDLADYAKLKPVFDRKYGSVTAGNSSPLTDGASALLLMNEAKAEALGMPILGRIRSYAFAALDPFDQLLLGPAYATPIALERAGMTLADMDVIDMHEAFAATTLSTIQAFESATFAREKLNRSQPIGKVDWDKLNINGGSIAMGHPFAATGAREIAQTLGELKRRGGGIGLCTACAAGGMGAAMVLEVSP
ncbi:acetyl-CoA C-acyltransferase FadI [Nitrosococcus watsonii]|uniref:Acetyl-CoA acetyltransferase n=1 Tax=Nitrosococcus watsoni (strain C-113) TaxID=105559 RepID=D8K5X2_NITWC|nr:acetyl-CoA C-acyltransferase FadI [Nitrosococcus watsonii]ADJ28299.1 acetyl-CoA acetyltransferase [Nitrosococcus watsonii C-113]